MIVIGGINCEELVAEFSEGFGLLEGPTAQKGFLCPWPDRYTVANALLGLSSTTHIGNLTLNTPAQYPERATMYAHDIHIEGVGFPQEGPNGVMAFYRAIVSVNYQCLPWSFQGIDLGSYFNNIDPFTPLVYCRQVMDYSTAWITIPHRGLKFGGSGNFLKRDWKMPLCQIEMNLNFIRVPYLPSQYTLLTASLAPLNSARFLGAPAGYVLFNGFKNEQTRDTAGNFTQDVNYSFSYRSVPWDQDWDSIAGQFNQVQTGAGNPILQRSDLNLLIPPGYRIG